MEDPPKEGSSWFSRWPWGRKKSEDDSLMTPLLSKGRRGVDLCTNHAPAPQTAAPASAPVPPQHRLFALPLCKFELSEAGPLPADADAVTVGKRRNNPFDAAVSQRGDMGTPTDAGITYVRVFDQVFPGKFGANLAFLTVLAGTFTAVALVSIYFAAISILLVWYRVHRYNKARAYAKSPKAFSALIKGRVKRSRGPAVEVIAGDEHEDFEDLGENKHDGPRPAPVPDEKFTQAELDDQVDWANERLEALKAIDAGLYGKFDFRPVKDEEGNRSIGLVVEQQLSETKKVEPSESKQADEPEAWTKRISKLRFWPTKLFTYLEKLKTKIFWSFFFFWIPWLCATLVLKALDAPFVLGNPWASFFIVIFPAILLFSELIAKGIYNNLIHNYRLPRGRLTKALDWLFSDETEERSFGGEAGGTLSRFWAGIAFNFVTLAFIWVGVKVWDGLKKLGLVSGEQWKATPQNKTRLNAATQAKWDKVMTRTTLLGQFDEALAQARASSSLIEEEKKRALARQGRYGGVRVFPQPLQNNDGEEEEAKHADGEAVPAPVEAARPLPTQPPSAWHKLGQWGFTFTREFVFFEFAVWLTCAVVINFTRLLVETHVLPATVMENLMANVLYGSMPVYVAGSMIASIVFMVVAFVRASWKTKEWSEGRTSDVEKLNQQKGEREQLESNVNVLKDEIATLKAELKPYKEAFKRAHPDRLQDESDEEYEMRMEREFAESLGIDAQFVDATDIDNLTQLKKPNSHKSLVEKFTSSPYATKVFFMLCFFADSLFYGRDIWFGGTGVTTRAIQWFLNFITGGVLTVNPEVIFSLIPSVGLVIFVVLTAAGYGLLRSFLTSKESTHASLMQRTEMLSFQELCLKRQREIMQKQRMIAAHRATAAANSASEPARARAATPSPQLEDLPEPELSNLTIEKNKRQSNAYWLSSLSLIGAMVLLTLSFAKFSALPVVYISWIAIGAMVIGIFSLFRHYVRDRHLLSQTEVGNILKFAGSFAVLLIFWDIASATAFQNFYFLMVPPLLIGGFLYSVYFKTKAEDTSWEERIAYCEQKVQAILPEDFAGQSLTEKEDQAVLEHVLDTLIMELNPNDQGHMIDMEAWKRTQAGQELNLSLRLEQLKRIRTRVREEAVISEEDVTLLKQSLALIRTLPRRSEALPSRPVSAVEREEVDQKLTYLIVALPFLAIVALAQFAPGVVWLQYVLVLTLPPLMLIKALVLNDKLRKNYLHPFIGQSGVKRWLMRLLAFVLFAGVVALFTSLGVYHAHLEKWHEIVLALSGLILAPIAIRMNLDAWENKGRVKAWISRNVSPLLSPRFLMKWLLTFALLGSIVGFGVSIGFAASGKLSLVLSIALPVGFFFAAQLIYQFAKVVFEFRNTEEERRKAEERQDGSSWGKHWFFVPFNSHVTSFFFGLNCLLCVGATLVLAGYAVAFSMGHSIASPLYGFLAMAGLPVLGFFMTKVLWPRLATMLLTGRKKEVGSNYKVNEANALELQKEGHQASRYFMYVALMFFVGLSLLGSVAWWLGQSTDFAWAAHQCLPVLAVWTVGIVLGMALNYYEGKKRQQTAVIPESPTSSAASSPVPGRLEDQGLAREDQVLARVNPTPSTPLLPLPPRAKDGGSNSASSNERSSSTSSSVSGRGRSSSSSSPSSPLKVVGSLRRDTPLADSPQRPSSVRRELFPGSQLPRQDGIARVIGRSGRGTGAPAPVAQPFSSASAAVPAY